MDTFHSDDSAEADRKLNERLDEIDETSPDDGDATFLVRADELRQESLGKEDPRAACFGKINADVMVMLHHSGDAINNAFTSAKSVLELPHLERALKTYLLLARQLKDLANVEARFEELKQAKLASSKRTMDPLRGPNSWPR